MLLVVALVVVPLVEVYVLIQVGQLIGGLEAVLLLLVESLLGAVVLRREGAKAWRATRQSLEAGRMPGREIADGGDPDRLEPLERLGSDPPQAAHWQRVEVGQLLAGTYFEDAGAGPHALGSGPGLGLDRGQLGEELVGRDADGAGEAGGFADAVLDLPGHRLGLAE